MGLTRSQRENVTMGFYEAGHMMYVHTPSRKRMASDLRSFVKSASR